MARLWILDDVFEAARAEDNKEKRHRRREIRLEYPPQHADQDFVSLYRLTPALFEELVADLTPLLGQPRRSDALSPTAQVLTALAFYASGSYQRPVAQNVDLSVAQQTVSKCIARVTEVLNHPIIQAKYFKFPNSREQRDEVKQGFFRSFGMPGVIGCIDGTHVAIVRPTQHEERYINRKGYHSLNVQMVCDSNLRILSVDASYGGSSHDNYIFTHHELAQHMQQLTSAGESTWLLGDSGYTQREYLMIPIEDAEDGSPEENYNKVHMTTRNTIERTFGVLKARWRCLLSARRLHYHPVTAGRIVNACAVLHNICNSSRVPPLVPPLTAAEMMEEAARAVPAIRAPPLVRGGRDGPLWAGRTVRQHIVQILLPH